MSVRVDGATSRSLWWRRQSQAASLKTRLSNRVPAVRALWLTWKLPMEVLVRDASPELWAWSEHLHLRGPVSAASLESLVWPRALE